MNKLPVFPNLVIPAMWPNSMLEVPMLIEGGGFLKTKVNRSDPQKTVRPKDIRTREMKKEKKKERSRIEMYFRLETAVAIQHTF